MTVAYGQEISDEESPEYEDGPIAEDGKKTNNYAKSPKDFEGESN